MRRGLQQTILALSAAASSAALVALAPMASADPGECDASAGGELGRGVDTGLAEETPDPREIRWAASKGRQCRSYRGRRFCDGPRRVPEPHGAAAARARELGLDDPRQVARRLLNGPAPEAWVAAVGGTRGAGLAWPVPEGRLWRGFGRHRTIVARRGKRLRRGANRRMHRGVDIGAAPGSMILAADDALVAYSDNGMRGYGNALLLLHADGAVTLYGHCEATYVFAGQRVRRGQTIAAVGATGLAHGPHLHFEWRRDGRPVDPLPHFVGIPSSEQGIEDDASRPEEDAS